MRCCAVNQRHNLISSKSLHYPNKLYCSRKGTARKINKLGIPCSVRQRSGLNLEPKLEPRRPSVRLVFKSAIAESLRSYRSIHPELLVQGQKFATAPAGNAAPHIPPASSNIRTKRIRGKPIRAFGSSPSKRSQSMTPSPSERNEPAQL